MPHLLSLFPEELAALLTEAGTPCQEAEARRMLAALYRTGRPEAQRPVAQRVQRAVLALDYHRPEIIEKVADPDDHSVRYLLKAQDGAAFEVVRIPLEKPGCYSLCLSSQVGCAMRCAFCQTGKMGLKRNLLTEEIIGSFLAVREDTLQLPEAHRVTGAVFMGQGEPFHNYDAVIRAARLLSHPCGAGIDGKRISISTVGLVPQIHRYAQENHPYRLIVSLTSAITERRESLLPVAGRWSLAELADALKAWHQVSRSRVSLAWVLIGGLNHDAQEVAALKAHFEGIPLRLNLIDINIPVSQITGFRRATDQEREAFFDALQVLSIPIVRRYSVGRSQNSACGMLALREAAQHI